MSRMPRSLAVAAGLAVLGAGCGPSLSQLETRASTDLQCPAHQLQISRIDSRTRAVNGCNQRAVYVSTCNNPASCTWVLDLRERTTPELVEGAPAEPIEERPLHRERAELSAAATRDGYKDLRLHLSAEGWSMHVRAVPRKDANRADLVVRTGYAPDQCEVKFVADGERVATSGAVAKTAAAERHEYRTGLPYESLAIMARSTRVVGRVCDREFTLGRAHIERIGELVIRIREEFAWDESPPPSSEPGAPVSL